MIMEYNKKKMCGSFLSFPFFFILFDVIIIVYFLRINISEVAFCSDVTFSKNAVFVFVL